MAVDATFLAIATLLVAPATALHFPICHRANLRASTLATNLRASRLCACAADADNSVSLELLEAQLKEAVAREDYKAAAELKVKIDESPANVERMYAALQKRTSQLLTRRDMMVTERRHLLIPLLNAERAWAFSMELKESSEEEPRKRFHMLRRLRKAAEKFVGPVSSKDMKGVIGFAQILHWKRFRRQISNGANRFRIMINIDNTPI